MIERHDPDYGSRTMILVYGFMALCIPFIIFLTTQSYGPDNDKHLTPAGWVGLGLFVLTIVLAIFLVPHPAKRYRCKLCGRRIQPIPFAQTPKREHRFCCPDCEVIWTTNVYDEN